MIKLESTAEEVTEGLNPTGRTYLVTENLSWARKLRCSPCEAHTSLQQPGPKKKHKQP